MQPIGKQRKEKVFHLLDAQGVPQLVGELPSIHKTSSFVFMHLSDLTYAMSDYISTMIE